MYVYIQRKHEREREKVGDALILNLSLLSHIVEEVKDFGRRLVDDGSNRQASVFSNASKRMHEL